MKQRTKSDRPTFSPFAAPRRRAVPSELSLSLSLSLSLERENCERATLKNIERIRTKVKGSADRSFSFLLSLSLSLFPFYRTPCMQIAVSAEECRVARLFSAITRAIADEWSADTSASVLNASIALAAQGTVINYQ